MKRIEALNLIQLIEQLKNAKGIGFAYALMRNKKILDAEKENLSKTITITEEYSKFTKQMQDLLEEFCITENTTNTVILPDSVPLKDNKDREDFKKAVLDLRELYKEAIEERKLLLQEYQDFMNTEIDIDFYKLSEASLPDELSLHKLIMLAELINFEDRPLETIELTVFEILTYTNIFMQMLDLKVMSSSNHEARNKSLINFAKFREKHKELYAHEIIKTWSKYEKERKLLAEKHADVDVYGNVLIQQGKVNQSDQYVIKDVAAFSEELDSLNAKYEKELTDFQTFLSQKTSIEICKLNQEDLPNDINLEDLQTLELFIKN